MDKKLKTKHKFCIIALKYAPFLAGVCMWIHVILKLLGINLLIAENLVGLPIIPCLVCCLWSKTFDFCWLHRAFIAYTTMVTYCINWQADILGFGNLLTPMRWFMVLLGLGLIIIFFIKRHQNKYRICHGKTYDYKELICENCGGYRCR